MVRVVSGGELGGLCPMLVCVCWVTHYPALADGHKGKHKPGNCDHLSEPVGREAPAL